MDGRDSISMGEASPVDVSLLPRLTPPRDGGLLFRPRRCESLATALGSKDSTTGDLVSAELARLSLEPGR